jgi:WD40 repeat protein
VRVWDVTSSRELRVLRGHEGVVRSCAFSRGGEQVISSGDDGTVRVWDVTSGETTLLIQDFGNEEFAVISPRDNKILGATENAWRWLGWLAPDPKTGELTRYPAEIFGELPLLRRRA